LHAFGTENLRTLLEQTGFEIVKLHRYSVLPQFRVHRMLANVKNLIKNRTGQAASKTDKSSSVAVQPVARGGIKHALRAMLERVYHYLFYVLRYTIGRMVFKHERPQTVLVIARKRLLV